MTTQAHASATPADQAASRSLTAAYFSLMGLVVVGFLVLAVVYLQDWTTTRGQAALLPLFNKKCATRRFQQSVVTTGIALGIPVLLKFMM